jgi:FKBP-type peptidyl-prolyl cis-trans isomerase
MKILNNVCMVSLLFLTGCTQTNNDKQQKTEQKEKAPMTRQKAASGLEYEIIEQGSGDTPTKGQKVTVHYTGWLDNNGERGQKFDSSVDRGEPFTFNIGVGQVIKGWDEGVMGMKVGEKRRLIIPSGLGYGARGAGRIIPPHATLIFDVELLKVG